MPSPRQLASAIQLLVEGNEQRNFLGVIYESNEID